jgi:glycosyltransferase involved in cell wall biosynthesis
VQGGRLDRPISAPLAALAHWELGRRDEALAFVDRAAACATDRTAIGLAAVAMAVDRPATAARALEDRPPRSGRDCALVAEVAFRTGRFDDAQSAIDAARAVGYRHELLGRLEARLAADRRVLEPGWRPVLAPRRSPLRRTRGRIIHLLTNSLPDTQAGYTIRSQQVARSQRAVGLDPHMATRAGYPGDRGRSGAPAEELVGGVHYHRILPDLIGELPDRLLARNADAASELVETLRPAALQPASNHRNAQVALALRDRFGLPVVYEVRGFLEETWLARQDEDAAASERYRWSKAAETACMLAADAVVTLSDTMRRDIVGRGVAEDRVIVIPNAVEDDAFTPRPRSEPLARDLGIEAGDVVLGYVSTLSAYEGIRHLVEAAALLRDRRHPTRLLIVGDGPERPALEAQARSLGMLGGFRPAIFTGRVPHGDVARYYSLIDIFVVPRTADRVSQLVTPLKPYEAMAMERALVVSDLDALREVVSEGDTGLTFRAGDSAHLAEVLEPLLDDPERRAGLGRAARAWVLEQRTWRKNGERYRELYERLGVA